MSKIIINPKSWETHYMEEDKKEILEKIITRINMKELKSHFNPENDKPWYSKGYQDGLNSAEKIVNDILSGKKSYYVYKNGRCVSDYDNEEDAKRHAEEIDGEVAYE